MYVQPETCPAVLNVAPAFTYRHSFSFFFKIDVMAVSFFFFLAHVRPSSVSVREREQEIKLTVRWNLEMNRYMGKQTRDGSEKGAITHLTRTNWGQTVLNSRLSRLILICFGQQGNLDKWHLMGKRKMKNTGHSATSFLLIQPWMNQTNALLVLTRRGEFSFKSIN